jgi:hypothetical protein
MKVRIDPLNCKGEFDLEFYNSKEFKGYKKSLMKYLRYEGFLEDLDKKTFIITFFGQTYEILLNS